MSTAVGPCLPLQARQKLAMVEVMFQIGRDCAIRRTSGLTVATPQLLVDHVNKLIDTATDRDLTLVFSQRPAWTLQKGDDSSLNVNNWEATAHDRQILRIVIQSRLAAPNGNSNLLTVKLGIAKNSREIKLPTSGVLQICSSRHIYVRVIACQVTAEYTPGKKKKRRLVYHVSSEEHRLLAQPETVLGAILDSTSTSAWTPAQPPSDPQHSDLLEFDWRTDREQTLSSLGLDQELHLVFCGGRTAELLEREALFNWGLR